MSAGDTSSAGAPPPIETEHVLTLHVECQRRVDGGSGPYGDRRMIPITGGRFEGTRLRGEVLSGGADWQLIRPDGVLEVEAHYALRAEDGTIIGIRNTGIIRGDDEGSGRGYVRTVVRFEAPRESPHAWLNRSTFVATIAVVEGPAPVNVRVEVYRLI